MKTLSSQQFVCTHSADVKYTHSKLPLCLVVCRQTDKRSPSIIPFLSFGAFLPEGFTKIPKCLVPSVLSFLLLSEQRPSPMQDTLVPLKSDSHHLGFTL